MEKQSSFNKKELVINILVFCSFIFLVFIFYQNNKWKVLMGDDLFAVNGFKDNGFWGTIINPLNFEGGKIRPVSTVFLYLSYLICDLDFSKYYLVNRVVLVIVVFLVYILVKKFKINSLFAYIISVLLITSPFSSYSVWQMIGICESVSLLLSVLCLYYIIKLLYGETNYDNNKYIGLCTLFYFLLIFNAERFMYLIIIFISVIVYKKINIKYKIIYSLMLSSPILIRAIILKLANGDGLNTGRGEVGSLMSGIIAYGIRGAINLMGFSLGDQWLGGFDFFSLPSYIMVIGSLLLILSVGMFWGSICKWLKNSDKNSFEIFVIFCFSFSSLFSYALVGKTHGEDRFLWIPYVFLWIGIMKYITINVKCNWKTNLVVFGMALLFLISNFYYVKNKVYTNYRYSQEEAQTCFDNVSSLILEKKVNEICCIRSNDYKYIFYDQKFFEYYIDSDIKIYYYNSFEEIDKSIISENTIIIYPDTNVVVPYCTVACWAEDYQE